MLNPIVMSRTVKLNPLWILVSVIVGADLAGFLGALIGIPVAAMVQVIAVEAWATYQARRAAREAPDGAGMSQDTTLGDSTGA